MAIIHVHASSSSASGEIPAASFSLVRSSWNDWWEYETLYLLSYRNEKGAKTDIGFVKVASVDMAGKSPDLPSVITEYIPGVFSLGQDAEYYEALVKLGGEAADEVLRALGDIAADKEIRRQVLDLPVTRASLLRSVPLATVEGQFSRITKGGLKLAGFSFTYRRQETPLKGPVEVGFRVVPQSRPPTNIQVLVGRNGAGKSTLLGDILNAFEGKESLGVRVTSLVVVSFSAFDSFGARYEGQRGVRRVDVIGLKKPTVDPWDPTPLKNDEDLAAELKESLTECLDSPPKRRRLVRALGILENDPIFAESQFSEKVREERTSVDDLASSYWRLSSGHKIVLLTTTRLVELVEEKSLILIDEPEAHLHPPLLSAFTRALSDLLSNRNGLAIVATHSPVVLQEVPSTCVWKISRVGTVTSVGRPDVETFGENVGTLTHEIFGLEVRGTGYYRMLVEAALESSTYEEALEVFQAKVGQEGRAILRAQMVLQASFSESAGL